MVHLFTHPLAGAQGLSREGKKSLSVTPAVGFHLNTERNFYNEKSGAYFVFMQNPVGPVVRFAFHLGYRHN